MRLAPIFIPNFSSSSAPPHLSTPVSSQPRSFLIRHINLINPTDSPPFFKLTFSERQHAVDRYDQWQKIREKAVKNSNGKLPEGFAETEPPPPPPPVEEDDIVDLAIDLSAVSLDAEVPLGDLEDGIERVPMADPGLEVRSSPQLL